MNEVEESYRNDSLEESSEKNKEPKKRLKYIALGISSIGGILYIITSFTLPNNEFMYYTSTSMPFLFVGIISLIGTIMGVKRLKLGSIIILLSIPATFLIGLVYGPYLGFYSLITPYVLIPFPLPHSIFVITGGILCFLGTDRKLLS